MAVSTSALLRHQCFRPATPARSSSRRSCRPLHVVAALPQPLAAWKEGVSKAGKAALIAMVLSTGVSMAPPDLQLLQPARANDEAGILALQKRASANERRKALLAQARENALSRGELAASEDGAPADTSSTSGGNAGASSGGMSFLNVKSEQPLLKTDSAPPPPATPELPKSSMPEAPKFNMPSKPVQPPPSPSMSPPKDVPKTESPTLPVPTPGANSRLAPAPAPAPAPAAKTAAAPAPSAGAASQQGSNWEDFSKDASKPKAKPSPFVSVEPERKQSDKQPPVSKEQKARLVQQAMQQTPINKRKSKRHGPPLFLVQLLITVGLVAAVAAAVIKYDSMTENAAKLEKAIIQLAEKVQLPESLDKRPQP